ncbi:MAG: formamidopyrimidine-DNA glycosylase, partial [Chloroflexi bacterium]|nr:formamidopyrimidine-DNA glycosylase [Chloroflexota bacterium]
MPELPEVETIRRDLQPIVCGRKVRSAWISPNAPRLVQLLPREEFCRGLSGRRIQDVGRRGKYLLFRLDGGLTWIVHLRMTGRLQHTRDGCPDEAHLRAKFELDGGGWLCFIDQRKFGTMWLVDDVELVTGKLGPEPLGEAF